MDFEGACPFRSDICHWNPPHTRRSFRDTNILPWAHNSNFLSYYRILLLERVDSQFPKNGVKEKTIFALFILMGSRFTLRQPFGTLRSGSACGAPNTEYAVSLGCTSLHPYLPAVALRACDTTVKHRIFWNAKQNQPPFVFLPVFLWAADSALLALRGLQCSGALHSRFTVLRSPSLNTGIKGFAPQARDSPQILLI